MKDKKIYTSKEILKEWEEEKKKKYCCNMWKKGTDYINGFIFIGSTHGMKFDETYQFKYCPYCGKKVDKNE